MDPIIYISVAVFVAIILVLVTFLRRSPENAAAPVAEDGAERVVRPRRVEAGPLGRRNVRRRMAPAAQRPAAQGPDAQRPDAQRPDEEESGEDDAETLAPMDGKVGVKKLAKLQAKEERRRQREAEVAEREERKQREAELDTQRRKEEAREAAGEAAREEEERLKKEQKEKEEYEEYLNLKAAFSVEEEGEDAQTEEQGQNLLQEFINYIKDMKVVMLEDLASHFKIRTQDAIDRINTLIEEERLSGVMDDRGKFIYITREEYEAVAKFIKQRGRVSINELADSSNRLINLNPDKEVLQQKMMNVNV